MKTNPNVRTESSIIEVLESRIAPTVFTFSGGLNATWNDQNSWTNADTNTHNGFPGGTGNLDTAIFIDSSSPTVTLNADIVIGELDFFGAGSPRITGHTITFNNATASPQILVTTNTTPEVDSGVANDSTFPLTLASLGGTTSNLVLGGVLSDAISGNLPAYGGFFTTGLGKVTLTGSGANTFPNTGAGSHAGTGPGFIVGSGSVFLNKTNAVAISSDLKITLGSVTLSGSGGNQIADTAAVEVDAPGLFQLSFLSETIGSLSGAGGVSGTTGTKLTLTNNSTFGGSFGGTSQTPFDLGLEGKVLTLTGSQPAGTSAFIRTFGGQLTVTGSYPTMDIVLNGASAVDPSVLAGTGTVGNVKTTSFGVVAPGTGIQFSSGNGLGTLSVNNLSSTGGHLLILNLDVTSDGSDTIDLRGTIAANSVATQFLAAGQVFSEGQVFKIFNVPGTTQLDTLISVVQGGNSSFPEGFIVASNPSSDFPLHIHYNGGDGNDVALVAEPNLTSIAPTSLSADGKTATFLQEDGDTLTIKTSKGKFVAGNFLFEALPSGLATGAGRLEQLNVNSINDGQAFAGAAITGTVAKGASGDGFADVGSVDATGVDLGSFTLRGDLGQITAGDGNFKTAGLGTLSVLSLGAKGNVFYTADAIRNFTSTIRGKLGTLSVTAGKLTVANTPTLPVTAGTLGQAFVTVADEGSVASNKFEGIGKIIIDQVVGTNANGANETILNGATVAYTPGTVLAPGPIGSVLVNGAIIGGASDFSGELWSRTSIASVTVGGSIVGGSGKDSAGISVGSPDDSAVKGGKLGTVKIKGSLIGSSGFGSGGLRADGGIGAVTLGGGITANAGNGGAESASIISGAGIASVTIQHALLLGPAHFSGSIVALGGNIGAIKVGENLIAGASSPVIAGIFASGSIASITAGSMVSGGGVGIISAFGKKGGGNAIGSIKVTGDVTGWDIAAGFDTTFDVSNTTGGTFNPDASIGPVTVGGAFTNSAITAGTLWGPDGFAGSQVGHGVLSTSPDDTHLPGTDLPKVLAKIAQITITGQATGSVFEAQSLTGLKIAGVKAPLTTGTDSLTVANNSVATEIV